MDELEKRMDKLEKTLDNIVKVLKINEKENCTVEHYFDTGMTRYKCKNNKEMISEYFS